MRKGILAITIVAVVLAPVIIVGCGKTTTIKTPNGETKVEEDGNGSITINEGEESATLEQSKEAPSEKELGVPIYPEAEYDAENSGSVNYGNEAGTSTSGTAQFISEDSMSKIVDWYTEKLGAPSSSTSTNADWLVGEVSTGTYTAVHVEKEDGKTRISITHMAAAVK